MLIKKHYSKNQYLFLQNKRKNLAEKLSNQDLFLKKHLTYPSFRPIHKNTITHIDSADERLFAFDTRQTLQIRR